MREAHVHICPIEFGLRDLPGKLRLESSLTLALPDSWDQETTTADSLTIAAVAGKLWVERASPCRLGVQVTISGGTLAEEARSEGRIVEAIRRCSAWDLLGIELSRSQRPSQETNGDLHVPGALFSINHKSEASGHLSCHYAPRAQLRQLECRFNFDFDALETPKPKRTAPAPPHRPKKRSSSARVTRSMTRAMEEESIEADVQPRQPELPTATVDRSVGILTRASLYTLLGIEKKTPRAKMLRPFRSSALLDIAPAVWNMWYLQSIIDHAPSLQRISSVLGRLAADAQSPSLRHRFAQLAEPSPQGEAQDNEPDGQLAAATDTSTPVTDITDHIGQKLWPILQSGISFRKSPRSLASSNMSAPEPEDHSPEHFEYGNLTEASVDDYQAAEVDFDDYMIYDSCQDAEEPSQNDTIDDDEPYWCPEDTIDAGSSIWQPGGHLHYYNQSLEAQSQIDWVPDEVANEEDKTGEYDDPGSWHASLLAEELPASGALSWE